MKTILYKRESNNEKEYDSSDFNFNHLPRKDDIIKIGHLSYYKVDLIIFNDDENAESISIYATKTDKPNI